MKNLYDYERTQSATTDLPFGALKNESSPGKQDGTDIVAEHIQDLAYSLYQVLQLAGINPNGELEDGNNKTQFIESLTNIGVFRYSDKTSYNYGVFSWQVIGNTFTLYRSLKNSNSDDVNNNESWLKILEIGADNKINFNVDTNILGLSANPSLSNLSEAGEDRLNVSKMYETGAVSNDTKGFKELLKRAHSTFDKSKFEVVGTPTITDDGVASGFSNVNYIKKDIDFSNANSLKIQFNNVFIKNEVTNTDKAIFELQPTDSTSTFGIRAYKTAGSSGLFGLLFPNADGTQIQKQAITELGKDEHISGFVEVKNNQITLSINSQEVSYDISNEQKARIFKAMTLSIGATTHPGSNQYVYNGSIDLKSIVIWADGIPVFNGNKTGLYVAKPDNYEVVGSPTITDDGIASGFSDTNYVQKRLDLSSMKTSIKINASFIFDNSRTEGTIWNKDLNFDFRVSEGNIVLRTFNGSGSQAFTLSNAQTGLKTGDNVDSSVIVTENQAIIIINGKTYTKSMTTDLSNIATSSVIMKFGKANIQELYYPNLIDLNSFKIYVDGNLVYQPCLKIPYTEAFEHSNVVDVAYRNRVQDLYEQTGEALFYTLDEQNQNFSLPAGDIYGMITKNREILDIVYPIGRPMPEENNVLLDNEVWLEGATVNPIDYPKLFKVYGTKYGGDGITTFVLPDLRNRVLWGSPDGSNGYIEAKLPNIKGSCGKFDTYEANASGSLTINTQSYSHTRHDWGGSVSQITFDASRSNSIYSDSATTVQPPAFKVRWKTRFE